MRGSLTPAPGHKHPIFISDLNTSADKPDSAPSTPILHHTPTLSSFFCHPPDRMASSPQAPTMPTDDQSNSRNDDEVHKKMEAFLMKGKHKCTKVAADRIYPRYLAPSYTDMDV